MAYNCVVYISDQHWNILEFTVRIKWNWEKNQVHVPCKHFGRLICIAFDVIYILEHRCTLNYKLFDIRDKINWIKTIFYFYLSIPSGLCALAIDKRAQLKLSLDATVWFEVFLLLQFDCFQSIFHWTTLFFLQFFVNLSLIHTFVIWLKTNCFSFTLVYWNTFVELAWFTQFCHLKHPSALQLTWN